MVVVDKTDADTIFSYHNVEPIRAFRRGVGGKDRDAHRSLVLDEPVGDRKIIRWGESLLELDRIGEDLDELVRILFTDVKRAVDEDLAKTFV